MEMNRTWLERRAGVSPAQRAPARDQGIEFAVGFADGGRWDVRLSWKFCHGGKLLLALIFFSAVLAGARADSTINGTNRYAYGANLGWIDWRADGANGARVGEFICSGYLYAANSGWINLGSGTPADGIRYQNNSAADFGVNRDEAGDLRGLAWGANIGWLIFTNRDVTGAAFEGPKVDPRTGRLSGFVYSPNAGWINLSNTVAFVQSDSVAPGVDTDGDGLSDAWELTMARNLTAMNATSNSDGDGASDLQEYLADTDPLDPANELRIRTVAVTPGGTDTTVSWASRSTRFYTIQKRADFDAGSAWIESGLGLFAPDTGATTTRTVSGGAATQQFIRVEAVRLLAP